MTGDHVSNNISESILGWQLSQFIEVHGAATAAATVLTTTMSGTPTEQGLEEAFIKITFKDEREDQNKDPLYPLWTWKCKCHNFNPATLALIVSYPHA